MSNDDVARRILDEVAYMVLATAHAKRSALAQHR
jgi:hypothetical protein